MQYEPGPAGGGGSGWAGVLEGEWGMELFLGIGQLAAALAVAVFTWKLAIYTRELVKAQEASNRVLERQAEIQAAQQRLMELLEAKPWLVLGKKGSSSTSGGTFELYLTNIGRAGVAVVEALWHRSKPDRPRQGTGTALRSPGIVLPLALPPGGTAALIKGSSMEIEQVAGDGWLEVRYRALSAEAPLLSDLWRLGKERFVLEWAGEEVEEG